MLCDGWSGNIHCQYATHQRNTIQIFINFFRCYCCCCFVLCFFCIFLYSSALRETSSIRQGKSGKSLPLKNWNRWTRALAFCSNDEMVDTHPTDTTFSHPIARRQEYWSRLLRRTACTWCAFSFFFFLLFALLVFTIRHLQQFTIYSIVNCYLFDSIFIGSLSSSRAYRVLPLPQGVCDVTLDRICSSVRNSSNATDAQPWARFLSIGIVTDTSGFWIRINMQQKKLYCLPHALSVCVCERAIKRMFVCVCEREIEICYLIKRI